MTDTEENLVKLGDMFCPRGLVPTNGNRYTVMGLPRPRGMKWISVARDANGAVVSFPENIFHAKFYRITLEP